MRLCVPTDVQSIGPLFEEREDTIGSLGCDVQSQRGKGAAPLRVGPIPVRMTAELEIRDAVGQLDEPPFPRRIKGVLHDDQSVRNACGLTQNAVRVRRVMKDLQEQTDVKLCVVERQVGSIGDHGNDVGSDTAVLDVDRGDGISAAAELRRYDSAPAADVDDRRPGPTGFSSGKERFKPADPIRGPTEREPVREATYRPCIASVHRP